MNNKFVAISAVIALFSLQLSAQEIAKSDSIPPSKEENNRNVMLNSASSDGCR